MAPIVTSSARIMCNHTGLVTILPKQFQVSIQGGLVLCEGDLIGAVIVGCKQPVTTNTKPCTSILSTLPGSTSLKVTVGGRPVYVATLNGLTDGPGTLLVVSPGQTIAQA